MKRENIAMPQTKPEVPHEGTVCQVVVISRCSDKANDGNVVGAY